MTPRRATAVPKARVASASALPGPLGDVPPGVLRVHLHRVADWAADYRENIEQMPISPSVEPGYITAFCPTAPPENAESLDTILGELDTVVMPGALHWGHPAFVAYFGSTSNGPALLGEIAAAALNVSAMTWRTSPIATELETLVVDWIRQMVGLPDSFTGIVYDTASTGVLHAMAAARELAGANIRRRGLAGRTDLPRYRLYASDQAHSSIEKAAIMLGLGEENVVRIPSDEFFQLGVGRLREAIADDRRAGFHPLSVIATVGTTSTASIDPVAAIGVMCRDENIWLHVDAAYGGAMGILPEGRYAMEGMEYADSIAINPHKWMFVPLDFSTLYVRRPDLLRAVFSLTPEYLEMDAAGGAINYMDYGYQLGRRFRALKAWMTFRAFGRLGIESRIREHCRLAAHFAEHVRGNPSFDLAAPQSMAVVAFRFLPENVDADTMDRLNQRIVEAVNSSGRAYLTLTRLEGRVAMRIGIGNVLTQERHLDDLWKLITSAADAGMQPSDCF